MNEYINIVFNFLSYLKMDILGAKTPFNYYDLTIFILLIFILLILIGNAGSRRKINRRIDNIPGVKLNDKIFTDLKDIFSRVNDLETFRTANESYLNRLNESLKKVKLVKIKKYNPYADMGVGGNQSFSLSLLDAYGNGIILTSLYSRERTRVLVKEIKNFVADQELSPEERELLENNTNI